MSAASQITQIVMITDSYMRLLASLSSIQSMADMLSRTDADSTPNTLIKVSRVVFNEVTSALDAAQKMHAMLLDQRQGGFDSAKESHHAHPLFHIPIDHNP